MPVRQVNPFKLRQFARASGVLAKNDPLDARMIASFVAIMPTRPAQPHTPAIERLAEMLTVRRQLSTEKVAAETRSSVRRAPERRPLRDHSGVSRRAFPHQRPSGVRTPPQASRTCW
jgi:transposase